MTLYGTQRQTPMVRPQGQDLRARCGSTTPRPWVKTGVSSFLTGENRSQFFLSGVEIGVISFSRAGGCPFCGMISGRNPIIGIQGAVPIDSAPTAVRAAPSRPGGRPPADRPGIVPDGFGAEAGPRDSQTGTQLVLVLRR